MNMNWKLRLFLRLGARPLATLAKVAMKWDCPFVAERALNLINAGLKRFEPAER